MEDKTKDNFDEIAKIFKKRPETKKQTLEEAVINPDTLMNIMNREKMIKEAQEKYRRNPNSINQIQNKSIGKTKKTKKNKIKKTLNIAKETIVVSACCAILISSGLFVKNYVIDPTTERLQFEKDLKASLDIVTKDAKNNLEHLNLGYTDENGKFKLNDNDISDYANLGLSNPTPTEIRAYKEVIKDSKEQDDFIKAVYYTEGNFEHTYTDFNQYYRINGFTDPIIGNPSSTVFSNITESQLVDAYNNGSIYEVVHDLTNTQSKGGR